MRFSAIMEVFTMNRKHPIDSEWFRQMLKQQGKSVRGLARFMGMDPAAVSRMLNGLRSMSAAEQDKVSEYLGVGLEEVAVHRSTFEGGFAEKKQEAYAAPSEPGVRKTDIKMFTEADIIYKDGERWMQGPDGLIRVHPAFGCMKGTMTIPDDLDLTAPNDDWGSVYEND
jgi:transcriptional regulator with XRE-family HTH domain